MVIAGSWGGGGGQRHMGRWHGEELEEGCVRVLHEAELLPSAFLFSSDGANAAYASPHYMFDLSAILCTVLFILTQSERGVRRSTIVS